MSKIEGKIEVDAAAGVDASEILREIAACRGESPRKDAVARYLAAGDGWKEASAALRGAFAKHSRSDG